MAHLHLAEVEKPNTKFYVIIISHPDLELVEQYGYVLIRHNRWERSLWEYVRTDDLLLIVSDQGFSKILACKIIGRDFKAPVDGIYLSNWPYAIVLDILGESTRSRINDEVIKANKSFHGMEREAFQAVWEKCEEIKKPYIAYAGTWYEWYNSKQRSIKVHVASSHDDFRFIFQIASHHSFGYHEAVLTLVAKSNGVKLGAVLAGLTSDTRRTHFAHASVFGDSYKIINQNSVIILRFYNLPNVKKKWEVHDALFRAIESIAPMLVQGPLCIIEGISYDYHPLALRWGFNVEIPRKVDDTFYYWKPYNLPNSFIKKKPLDPPSAKRAVQEVLKMRRSYHYWVAPAQAEYIESAVEHSAWAIRDNRLNLGMWKSLDDGDVVLLKDRKDRILAYGVVKECIRRITKPFEDYPLWITFSKIESNLDIDFRKYTQEKWYTSQKHSGLIPIPDEYAHQIELLLGNKDVGGGYMWVEPNPYLLRRTKFGVIKNQIFVVIAWNLVNSVYSVIKEILKDAGYSAKYAGDRDGQVVFEDIWLLLNESEAVIVDFTHKRPNVYLEYGMALVLGKPIIAITQNREDIPSDTPNLKYILYEDKLSDNILQTQLIRSIRDTMEDISRAKNSL